MTTLKQGCRVSLVLAVLAMLLTGCRTEYHGYDSGIDGVLWRQIASFEDLLSRSLFQPLVNEPVGYLDALEASRWSGSVASAADLDLRKGGAVLYDISSTDTAAELSVFIASGPRADLSTDDGRDYEGPSAVFTCYGIKAKFRPTAEPSVDRVIFTECPAALVDLLPRDAAFASGEVFDG